MAIAHLYLAWRLTQSARFLSKRTIVRWLPFIVLLTFYCLPITGLITYGIQGRLDLLEIPKPITYWFWFGFAASYQLLTWIIVLDIIKVGAHFLQYGDPQNRNRLYSKVVWITVLLVLVFSSIKMYLNTTQIDTQQVELTIENLPRDLQGLRIVHISDIQGDQYTGREEIAAYIDKVNAQDPDIVIFTGDLISYGTDYIEMSAEEFAKVKATYGAYAVVGDHDYWADLSNVEPALESKGIPLLRDENRIINVGKVKVLLTGITQVYSKRADPEKVRQLTADSVRVNMKILAAHQVSDQILNEARNNNYHLYLAGHTHGGQVRVPLFGMTFSASEMETEYVSGTYKRGDLLLNINNGLGFTLAPVRYNAPPAITVIELN
ncbi:metallophosphoesterase [Balneolaceae bacterium YR4-1]|uniref:Metallophosphoesterase n=2 Tax=Halalkalibaculum roseum TaxID=2709311 RepID=A0A6M1SQ55_9BACT|nr:metallophosphoesterase [Halalkalibaculum roseum]